MPAIATITVRPEMSTERPDVAAAASSAARPPGGPLLAFPLQVEHRVVDPDGEPDQEHERAGLLGHRQDVARDRDQPERREDGGQGQQQRNARGDERPEGDHEDEQRDREREEPGLLQVLGERRVDGVDHARVAELANEELRVGLLHFFDPVDDRGDLVHRLVLVPADLELDEGRMPVLRNLARVLGLERRPHVLNDVETGDPGDDVGDRGLEGRIAGSK
jgi:hypothetical protein